MTADNLILVALSGLCVLSFLLRRLWIVNREISVEIRRALGRGNDS